MIASARRGTTGSERPAIQVCWLEQTVADVRTSDDWLSPAEVLFLSQLRFAKRRADWRLGRWTAKLAAFACLGMDGDMRTLRQIELRPDASGAPELYVGNGAAEAAISISHRAGRAACAVAVESASLGCDLELIEMRSSSFVTDYFTSAERLFISGIGEKDRAGMLTLMWSAKESALKALHQGLRIDTCSLAVTLDWPQPDRAEVAGGPSQAGWRPLQVRHESGAIFPGWWQLTNAWVRTLVARPAPLSPRLL